MPKRSADSKISYYQQKIKKLKECSNKKRNRVIIYSSSSDSETNRDDGIMQDDNTMTKDYTQKSHDVQTTSEQVIDEASELVPELIPEFVPELDPELLLALGDYTDEQPAYGENIHQTLAQRWTPILKKGLSKDLKDKLLKEYLIPGNCKFLKAPTLNPEVKAAVSDTSVNRDRNIQMKQEQLGHGLAAVNKAITQLLLGDDKIQAIKTLSDACRILTDLHYTETQVRTKLLTPCLDKTFTPLLKDHERDETLFGEKLSETIKASKAIERQSAQIRKSVQRTMSVTGATPGASTSRMRQFSGNGTGSPRYPSVNRGGRGGPPRATSSSRRTRLPPTTPAPAPHRAFSTQTQNKYRAYTRR